MPSSKDDDLQGGEHDPETIANLANVLKDASAALARLSGSGKSDELSGAAAALAQVASSVLKAEGGSAIGSSSSALVPAGTASLVEKLKTVASRAARGELSSDPIPGGPFGVPPNRRGRQDRSDRQDRRKSERQPSAQSPHRWSPRRSESRPRKSRSRSPADFSDGDIKDFISSHGLDDWVGDALLTLSASQLRDVMDPQLNVEHARNPNGVVMSRVRQVTTVEERVQMFIKVNDLGDGVIDRLSTLTPEQCEAVMDSGLKILRANNPSGVAMTRITNVLKTMGDRGGRPVNLQARQGRGQDEGISRRDRSRSRHRKERREVDDIPSDVKHLMQELALQPWCGEVLKRISLTHRKKVVRDLGNMRGVRNPSGFVMSRIKQVISPEELVAIFVDINGLDKVVEAKLGELTPEQRMEVLAPGIYVQNVNNTSTAVRTRILNVLQGKSAMNRPPTALALRDRDDAATRDHRDRSRSRSHRRQRRHCGSSDASGSGSPSTHRRRHRGKS
eukprot:TRINITY_DN74882_c0_g1_i1.p1 TRINITY_DN74882_c0_g1~~TRINITY_DN74882_c0_g1_i1.p1  ORF type:complete len:505 (+),score=59.36 TRINITY_DN74882_c0_g1_i1:47-1561(+)